MPFPARLQVLLAARAPVGVIIWRGPATAVCTVGWDREKNRYEQGQWLRGRAPLVPSRYIISTICRSSGATHLTEGDRAEEDV